MMQEYTPGMFSRRRTGSLDGIRMCEEEIKMWHQVTGGMRKLRIADQKTNLVPIPPCKGEEWLNDQIKKPLYTDSQGRVCLKMTDLVSHTIDIVDAGVQLFYELSGQYPTEIVLCPSRSYNLRNKLFYPKNLAPIPYVRDFAGPFDYDILLRRKV
jgi:hypothetical protein